MQAAQEPQHPSLPRMNKALALDQRTQFVHFFANSKGKKRNSFDTHKLPPVVALSQKTSTSQDKLEQTKSWPLSPGMSSIISNTSAAVHQSDQPTSWHPTWLRSGPLAGILGMLVASASIIASLGILIGSDHQKVSGWRSPPSTYLAIFTAIANLSMRYAALHGVVICWWYRACKGSTLSKLHWDWRSGTTVLGECFYALWRSSRPRY